MQRHEAAEIERIRRMEQAFDQVSRAIGRGQEDEETKENICLLQEYMTGGQWLADYERDEQGGWPETLKRGVLSQDALYDLLSRIDGEEN